MSQGGLARNGGEGGVQNMYLFHTVFFLGGGHYLLESKERWSLNKITIDNMLYVGYE